MHQHAVLQADRQLAFSGFDGPWTHCLKHSRKRQQALLPPQCIIPIVRHKLRRRGGSQKCGLTCVFPHPHKDGQAICLTYALHMIQDQIAPISCCSRHACAALAPLSCYHCIVVYRHRPIQIWSPCAGAPSRTHKSHRHTSVQHWSRQRSQGK